MLPAAVPDNLRIVTQTLLFLQKRPENLAVNTNNSTSTNEDLSHEGERNAVGSRIRAVLAAHGRLGIDATKLSDSDDLYAAGMTSLSSVNVMLALESEFNIEFPDSLLNRSLFANVAAIQIAVRKLASG
jgi:acyl carrier protein